MASSGQLRRVARFGPFELDFQAAEVSQHGRKIKLQGQPVQILALLLERRKEVVTREELRQKLWPAETFVDFDDGLNTAINRLRNTLGNSAEDPRFIETLPRRGYRFIAPVEEPGADLKPAPTSLGAEQGDASPLGSGRGALWAPEGGQSPPLPSLERPQTARSGLRYKVTLIAGTLAAVGLVLIGLNVGGWRDRLLHRAAAPRIESLAVLPLENLSGDKEQEYFADGMTDALITDLAQISALRVISRTSVMRYKAAKKPLPEIAQELQVDAIVEGTVQRSGNRVRITAQLIRAARERHLWAETYERDLGDVLALQGEVARSIAHEIQINLTPEGLARLAAARPVNPEAYEAYLKGRYHFQEWSADGTKMAIDYFQKAIEKEPKYAQAYAGLAQCYMAWAPLPRQEAIPKAKAATMKALELDETLGEAHTSLAMIGFLDDWDWSGADKEFKRAIELSPNYSEAHHLYSHYLMEMGRTDESLAESKRNVELDPLSPAPNLHLGWHYLFARQYDQAIEQLQKTLKMDPNYVEAHSWLGQAYEQKRMYDEAIAEFRKAVALSGGKEYHRGLLGHAYALSGKRHEAQTMISELKSTRSPASSPNMALAIIYTGLGNQDKAFEWLEKAYEQHDSLPGNTGVLDHGQALSRAGS